MFELSPFVVQASEDSGYFAQSTLAGTRLSTRLSDLAASVSIYTRDFIEDIGATDTTDLLVYATGMETAGAGGNFSGVGNDVFNPRPTGENARYDPHRSSRTRGLAAPTQTRNYFRTSIPNDFYNRGSVTINRGPNAALFGIGSPAGVVETSLLQPEFSEDSFTGHLRIGNNNSVRSWFDINHVSIPNKLGFRFAGVYDENNFNQKPAYQDRNRFYGAVTYIPLPRTQIRANFEVGQTRANRPLQVLPYNSIAEPWYDAGRPSYDWTFYDDPVRNPDPDNRGIQTEGFLNVNNNTFHQPMFVYNNPSDQQVSFGFVGQTPYTTGAQDLPNRVKSTVYHPIVNQNMLFSSIRFLHTPNIGQLAAGYWDENNVPPGQLPGYVPAGIRMQGFTDYEAFPFNRRMIDETARQGDDFKAFNFAVDQTAWNNRIGISLTYDYQEIDRYAKNSFFSSVNAAHIYVDTSVTLPTGEPNPNLGRPFGIYGQSNWRFGSEKREGAIATGFIKYDFKDINRSWGNWLGRHILTGMLEHNRVDSLNTTINTATLGTAAENINPTAALNSLSRRPAVLVYMGPSLIGNENPLQLEAVRVNEINAGPMGDIRHFIRQGNSNDPGTFVDDPAYLTEIAGPGSASREVIESKAMVLQSYWLEEHIITTLSWRRDENYFISQSTNFVSNPADLNDPGQARYDFADFEFFDGRPPFSGKPPKLISKDVKGFGIVARLPKQFSPLPENNDFSLFYNEASNFTPIGGRITAFNEPVPPPEGKTREMGFNLNTFNERLNIRVNWYKTTMANATSTPDGFTSMINTAILSTAANWATEANVNPHLAEARAEDLELLFSTLPDNFRDLYDFNVIGEAPNISVTGQLNTRLPGAGDTTDYTARGVELEMTYNPTPQWRILLNAAKQETTQTNTYPFMRRYLDLMAPVWEQLADKPRLRYPQGHQLGDPLPPNVETYGEWLDANVFVPLATDFATEGSVSAEQRKYRLNLVTNYSFWRGDSVFGIPLRGISVGSGVRYQSRVAIGYPTSRNPDGSVDIHIDRPYYGPSEVGVDLWASYSRRFRNDRLLWRINFRVTNAFTSSRPIPISAQPWGDIAHVRIPAERRWYLTNTISF